jgi:hypothetical protein
MRDAVVRIERIVPEERNRNLKISVSKSLSGNGY